MPDWSANVRFSVVREQSMDGVYVEGEHTGVGGRSDVLANRALFKQLSELLRLGYRRSGSKETDVKKLMLKRFIQDYIV